MAVEIVTLMVLLSGQGTDLETLWNTAGGVNDAPSKYTTPIDEIIFNGQFRSAIIDSWDSQAFEEVRLVGMNHLGDKFWSTDFDATGTNFAMSSWLIQGTFLRSTAVPAATPVVTKSDQNYALRISPASDNAKAWFAITANTLPTYPPLPLFYAAKKPSVPFQFPELKSGSLGCVETSGFSNYTQKYSTSTDNTPEMCIAQCDGFHAAILMKKDGCHCGHYDSLTSVMEIVWCPRNCPGDASKKCGGYFDAYGSAYHIQGDVIPGEMVTAVYYTQSHALSGTSLQLDWLAIVAAPPGDSLLATSFYVQSSVSAASFSISYSHLECNLASTETTKLYHNGSQQSFPIGAELDVGIISYRCITFTFDMTMPNAMIRITGPTDSLDHIQVPVVAVQATRTVPDTTTTTTTTSTSTSTTTPTTTSTTTTTPTTTSTTTATPTTTSTFTTTPTTTSTSTTTPTTTSTSTTTPTTTSTSTTTPTTTSTTTTTPTTTSSSTTTSTSTTTPTTTSTSTTTPTTSSTSTTTPTTSSTSTTTTTPTTTSTSTTTPTTTSTSSTTSTSTTTLTSTSTSSTTTPTSTATTTPTSTSTTPTTTSTTSTSSSLTSPISTSSTTPSSNVQSSTSHPKRCFCPCRNSTRILNMSAEELRAKVISIQRKLALNVSELSSTIRKLTSAEDNRPSAISVGFIGVSILVGVIGILILIDASTLLRDFLQLKDNIKSWLSQQDVAPS